MLRALIASASLLALTSGCSAFDPPAPPAQTILIRVSSDPGQPLKDAQILFGGKQVGATGVDGVAEVRLAGRDGETFEVTVACPKGFESPSAGVRVVFRRLADQSKKPEYEVQCPPKTRTVVVAVRAQNGPDLPVTLLGREIARTDDSGAAHVVLTLEPGEQFDLTLDTSDEEGLLPHSPAASFGIGHQDDIFTFEQKFERKRRVVTGRGRARPVGPVKIGP